MSSKFNLTTHIVIKSTAQILNRGEKTDMTRGWPQGRFPGVDIWPGRAGGEHVTKHNKKEQKKKIKNFFQVVKTFPELVTSRLGVRPKREKELLGNPLPNCKKL